MKVAGLEETNASALALVAQQIQFPCLEVVRITVVERLEILHEPALALVERRGADLYDVRVQIEKRLVQVLAEPNGLHALELPWFEVPLLNRDLELPELGDDVVPRPVDQDAVIALIR